MPLTRGNPAAVRQGTFDDFPAIQHRRVVGFAAPVAEHAAGIGALSPKFETWGWGGELPANWLIGIEIGPRHPILQTVRGSAPMVFRTNYRLERAERDRIKKAKKEEKLKRQQERAAGSPTADSPGHPDENTRLDE